MVSKLGICSLLAGFFAGLFAGISGFMEKKTFWSDLTISKIIGVDKSESIIEFFNIEVIQNSLDTLFYEIPFFIVLIGVGVLFLVVSLFLNTHKK